MPDTKLFTEAFAFIRQQEFVTVGTANLKNRPHTSLKMVLSAQGRELVLVEYRLGHSYRNLKENPLISISTFDIHAMQGYHIYGRATLISRVSPRHAECVKLWDQRQIDMATQRVIERVRDSHQARSLKMAFLKPKVFYQVQVTRIEKVEAVRE